MFFAYTKLLGRTETRTRDRICFQTIRTVRDISRDDRATIATCCTPTDLKENIYSIDVGLQVYIVGVRACVRVCMGVHTCMCAHMRTYVRTFVRACVRGAREYASACV